MLAALRRFLEEDAMINFDEEIKKYKPSLEVSEAEDVVYRNDLRDVTDIIEDMLREVQSNPGPRRTRND